VLLYFDHFAHPLNAAELYDLLGLNTGKEEFLKDLETILEQGFIAHDSGYYFIAGEKTNIRDRLEKLRKAEKHFRIASYVSRLIFWHPFVRGVFISGSLSKSTVSRKDDIDFFVITEPGRLWICRTFLMLFKKVFLLNTKKYFCINYFIDSDSLEIPEKNLFTAVELAFLRPLQNPALYMHFMETNSWLRDYFPNKKFYPDGCMDKKDPWFKKTVEFLLKGKAGENLDNRFLHIYRKRAERKFGFSDQESFDLNFRTRKNVSKHHPNGYQQKILDEYGKTIREFELSKGIDLTLKK